MLQRRFIYDLYEKLIQKPVFEKKNGILFTVDLRILETIERLFGKPASYGRAT